MAVDEPDKAIETLLRYIEEAIPTPSIFIKEAENKETPKTPFADFNIDLVSGMIKTIYDNQISNGLSPAQAKAYLKTVEPFNNYEDLIEAL